MPRQVALFICVAFIMWLFLRDRKLRPMTSIALWIPLFWFIIIGTRGVSMWFSGGGLEVETLDDYLQGSPIDRNIDIGLLLTGLAISLKRQAILRNIFRENRLFLAFFVLCGISCLWSDSAYAFASFKRYIRDVGNLMMVLIIMSEAEPGPAIKALLARYSYIAVIFSVLFIFYFPEYGRVYNRYTGDIMNCGITTNKNGLGQIMFICGIFVVWDFLTGRSKEGTLNKLDLFTRGILFTMIVWLLYMAHSSTSIVCMIVGSFFIIFLNSSFGKQQVHNLGLWTSGLLIFAAITLTVPELLATFANLLGRNATLTGRTDIWQALLAQPLNPLLGAGYQSFWQTPAAAQLGEKFYFIPNQAHNGYLEVYIQTGLISLFLLAGAIVAAVNKLKKGLLLGNTSAMLLFSFFIIILINNWTEASINKMSILWFMLILSLLYCPKVYQPALENDDVNKSVKI